MKKLLFLAIIPLFLLLFSASGSTIFKNTVHAACNPSSCNTDSATTCQCNGNACQTQGRACSNSSVVCAGLGGAPCCVNEWSAGHSCPQTQCNGGAGCGAAKYSCASGSCAPDPSGTFTESTCGGTCSVVGPPPPPPPPGAPPGTCFKCSDQFPNWDGNIKKQCYKNVNGGREYEAPTKETCVPPATCWAGCGCGEENPCHKSTSREPGFLPCSQDGSNCNTAIGSINATDFSSIVKRLFSVILGLAGGIAVLLIIWSGYKLTTSRGDPERLQNAREQLTAAIVGLLFVIFSLLILQVIGYNILGISAFGP